MVGERILGRFRIEDRIGSGGFGTVYRAWDETAAAPGRGQDDRPRARRAEGDPRGPGRRRLAHRNIATLYELASDGERAFLVSELIEGETLRVMGRRGELNGPPRRPRRAPTPPRP